MNKKWLVKEVSYRELESELNALSREGYEIYSLKETLSHDVRIIAYKVKSELTPEKLKEIYGIIPTEANMI